ncbi:MAG TPA: NAD-dependent succinate-semialdehyde dehydrogenase [Chlamydiales bacterium]|nr:NAD-dependent succinate-semialdehyde dehydrogenase [Chlamydiales bacterium]
MLLKTKGYIDGKWVAGRRTFPVFNPFDGKQIAKVADLGRQEAKKAVEAAHRAFPLWSAMLASERAKKLIQLADLIEKNAEELSHLLTLEQGKPLTESKDEVLLAVHSLKWLAEEGRRIHGYTHCDPDGTRSGLSIRQPMGVVAAITPWNFPFYVPVKTLAALAAGCTLVLKPAEDTPLSSLALAALAHEAGLPPGVLNIITCKNPKEVGEVLSTHPLVKKIAFTGSTEVGKLLLKAGAATVKKATMELGGNCPLIIFDDADLDQAIEGAFSLKFLNAGQCCNGLNRFLVHASIYDAFIKKCIQKAKKLTCGSGLKQVDLGPLINTAAKEKVDQLIKDAIRKGAEIILHSTQKGLLCSPIILKHASPKMRIWREEIFGPVIALYRFKTEKEAIEKANDTRYGLAAYFYTENQKRAMRVAKALQAGTVGVNTTNVYTITLPFGGWKESGIGREGGIIESLNDYCELKAISFGH